MWIAAAVALVIFVLDQVSKYYVVHVLNLDRRLAIDVWPPFFNLRMAWNQGINFGLLAGEAELVRWALIAIALVISAWVWIWAMGQREDRWVQVSAGLLVGGAVGNVIDRLLYGAVADFINMSCCGIRNPYAFNVADVAIFAGAAGLILFSGRRKTA
ncbi:signal peptidase II [Halodurantibacterium flavum]|uniref:Lipoprotein signal peptidase n=1 Tax=Halodurantibacterium flavum TaxID=1382802 RepID=A0ABW4S6Q0_9RHOB